MQTELPTTIINIPYGPFTGKGVSFYRGLWSTRVLRYWGILCRILTTRSGRAADQALITFESWSTSNFSKRYEHDPSVLEHIIYIFAYAYHSQKSVRTLSRMWIMRDALCQLITFMCIPFSCTIRACRILERTSIISAQHYQSLCKQP